MKFISPYQTLQHHASHASHEALVINDVRVGYGEFLERVSAFASWLLNQGFVPGRTTGICIRDEIQHLVCAMTLLCLDTPQISLGSHEISTTKRALARKVGAMQLVVDQPEDWMEAQTTVLPRGDPREMPTTKGAAANLTFPELALSSIFSYQNTSGSTSIPRTFGFTLQRLHALAVRYAADPSDRRALRVGSIEFDAHRFDRMATLLAGSTCVFLRQMSRQSLATLCHRAEVTTIRMGAYKLASLLQEAPAGARLPSFTRIVAGGSRVPGSLRRQIKTSLTDNLFVLYAASEVGLISLATPDQHERFPEGVGFPATGAMIEIVDGGGEPVGPGEIGEIRVRRKGMATEYLAENNRSSNFNAGWFYPRDLVSLSDAEPLIFHGRADEVMILNGINIFPSAIEDVLESQPDILEAVAYPIKSRIHGEIPVAAVVIKDGMGKPEVAHLLDLCRIALGIRAPREIFIVDRIPRNPAGKPLRRELAAR